MKIACLVYPGMSVYDLVSLSEPLQRLGELGLVPGLEIDTCLPPFYADEFSEWGIVKPPKVTASLESYAGLVLPGSRTGRVPNGDFLAWLATAQSVPLKAAVGSGAGLLDAAGLLTRAKTFPALQSAWQRQAAPELDERVTLTGDVLLAQNSAGALDLALQLCERLAGKSARDQVAAEWGYPAYTGENGLLSAEKPEPRTAQVVRETRETRILVDLALDGAGKPEIHTGLPFLDHMLTQIAVHGLFDLRVDAEGDLEIDPHHTLEDTALTLGKAFDQALGDRKGLVRMASATVPMDECLASVTLDFSGRPYAVVQVEWNGPVVGGISTTLFAHFLESFAIQARCNLHVRLLAGRDDHHRAEAIFKALARALDAATRLDPRRAGSLPTSKGAL